MFLDNQFRIEVKDLDEILWNGTGLIRLKLDEVCRMPYRVDIVFPESELKVSKELEKNILEYFNNLQEKCNGKPISYAYYTGINTGKFEMILEIISDKFFSDGKISLLFTPNGFIEDETITHPIFNTYYGMLSPILYALKYAYDKISKITLIKKIDNTMTNISKRVQSNLEEFCIECEESLCSKDFRIYEFNPEDIFYYTIGFEPFSLQQFFKEEEDCYIALIDNLHFQLGNTLEYCDIEDDERIGRTRIFAIGNFTDEDFITNFEDAVGDIFTFGGFGLDYIGDKPNSNEGDYDDIDKDFCDGEEFELCLCEILESYEELSYYKIDDK